jgi:hypothetical protein
LPVRYAWPSPSNPAIALEPSSSARAAPGWPNTDLLPAEQRQPFLDREQTTAAARLTIDPTLPAGGDRTLP